MSFTSGNDINILQETDSAFVGAGAGDDTYIVTPTLMTAGQEVTISDVLGVNTLQLIDGLTIASSIVVSNALQLTLNNGAIITVLGADIFTFNVGGNNVAGVAGVNKDFTTFATENLEVTVPEAGAAAVSGGGVTFNEDGTSSISDDGSTNYSIDIGTLQSPVSIDAGTAAFNFTDNASVLNNVVINNFTSDDRITISNAQETDYSFSNDGTDMNIVFNNNGTVNMISLMGVVDSSIPLDGQEMFEEAIGFNAFTSA